MRSKKTAIKVIIVATLVSTIGFDLLAQILGQGNCSRNSNGRCSAESVDCSSSSPSSSGSNENGSWSRDSVSTSGSCDDQGKSDKGNCNCH